MSDYDRIDPIIPRRRWARGLALPLLAFIAGLLAMGWALTRWETAGPFLSWMRPGAAPVTDSAAPQPQPIMSAPSSSTVAVERHVAGLETKLDQIAERADAAAGNADRAESLLVAFAARRAIERGLPLGYVEGLLREHFGRREPQAVATILTAARQPVTLADLEADLETLAPMLAGPAPRAGFWEGVKRELADMVVVRRTDLPPATPDDRIARARRALATGHVDRALADIARLPAREKAEGWIGKARRYILAQNALDRIEAAALLTPAAKPMTIDTGA